MSTVLVLNMDHTPLTTCSVERAFTLMFLNKAELVSSDPSRKLRSITQSFAFPSVIKIKRYVSIPYKGVVMSRHNIFKRDGGLCQYCGTNQNLTIDHVVPRSKGGKSTWTNLVTACNGCNSRKSDYALEQVGMKLRSQPRRPSHLSFLRMKLGELRDDWKPYLNPKKASA